MVNINLTNLIVATTLVETITVIIVYFKKNQGKFIAKWYNNLRIGAFFMDVLSAIAPVFLSLFLNNNIFIQGLIILLVNIKETLLS
jgi:hypothetical protein